MGTLQQCIESLAVCHLQEELLWPAARNVARQDIEEYVRDAGPESNDKFRAIELLASEFNRRFPDEADPVFIRSYMRRIMRRIGFELRPKPTRPEDDPYTASALAKDSAVGNGDITMANHVPMTEQQRLDIARLCHEANVPDKSGDRLSAQAAQQLINELREKAAELLGK